MKTNLTVLLISVGLIVLVAGGITYLGYQAEVEQFKGYYAEVVGTTPSGINQVRFFWMNPIMNSTGWHDWGECDTTASFRVQGFSNQTFLYFTTSDGFAGFYNAKATQTLYERGAVCPP